MTADIPDQAVARLMRSRRLAMGLSQARLGELVGTSATTVRRWERGESSPSPDALLSLAEALEVAAQELMSPTTEANDKKAAVTPTMVSESPAEAVTTDGEPIPTGVEGSPRLSAETASAVSSLPAGSVQEIDTEAPPDPVASEDPESAEAVPQPGDMASSGTRHGSRVAEDGESGSGEPWIDMPTGPYAPPAPAGEETPVPAGTELDGADHRIDVPTEQIEPPTAGDVEPGSGEEPATVPRAVPPPSPRPVAVLEPVDYRDDPLQRLRYALRAVLTFVALVAMAIVLVWAFAELWDAIDSVLDLFTEDTIPDVTNGSGA